MTFIHETYVQVFSPQSRVQSFMSRRPFRILFHWENRYQDTVLGLAVYRWGVYLTVKRSHIVLGV